MLKVFPIPDKKQQEKMCALCAIPFETDLLAYQATVEDVFVGMCQFKLSPEGGIIYHLAPLKDQPVDNEALFVMGRAALNFIDLCGIHRAFYDGDESIPGAQLLHAVGFRKNADGRLEMDLTGFFTAPCQHCKD